MVNAVYSPTRCSICNRLLSQPSDPLSENCGGDCLACMVEAEDGRSASELPAEQLALWLDLRAEIEAKLTDKVFDDDPEPLSDYERFPGQDAFTVGWVARFEGIGVSDSAAWSLVRHIIRTVWRS